MGPDPEANTPPTPTEETQVTESQPPATPPLLSPTAPWWASLLRGLPPWGLVLVALFVLGTPWGRTLVGLPEIGEQAASATEIEEELRPLTERVDGLGRELAEERAERKEAEREVVEELRGLRRDLAAEREARREAEDRLVKALADLRLDLASVRGAKPR